MSCGDVAAVLSNYGFLSYSNSESDSCSDQGEVAPSLYPIMMNVEVQ